MLQDDFIDRLPEEGARLVTRSLLVEAQTASRRLADPSDAEALHDFRVALRRLRSTLSAYRAQLAGSISGKRRRQIRELASSTGTARDAEVQIAWLGAQRERLPRHHRPALDWLVKKLEARRQAAYRDVRQALRDRFQRLAPKLSDALAVYQGRLEETPRDSFAGTVAELLRSHVAALHEALEEVGSAADVEAAHRARIKAKRLRYLLEPLRGNAHADGSAAVKTMKGLQDVLGELHDGHVLASLVAEAGVEASSEGARRVHAAIYDDEAGERGVQAALRRSPRTGLLAIDRLVKRERDRLFHDLERQWLGGRDEPLVRAVENVAAALAARAGPGVEIERKYLLRAMPDRARGAPAHEIEQGWLPGEKLQERVRRVSSPEGERFFRCVKQGAGLRRTEIEEETSREVFDRLWPLTEGRRVRKRRHLVPEGDLVWEVDDFLDRDLVLAELELPGDVEPSVPEWLAPAVVREVTGDPRYLNATLALARPSRSRGAAHSKGLRRAGPRRARRRSR
jgi:CHAD domain-containing protein/CYTH domain-containing protein